MNIASTVTQKQLSELLLNIAVQSSTPDIPRPRWIPEAGSEEGRTYGVIIWLMT